jgi:hypothetical protein
MPEPLTLESLAKRVEELERKLASQKPTKDWRSVVGMFDGSEFMKRKRSQDSVLKTRHF